MAPGDPAFGTPGIAAMGFWPGLRDWGRPVKARPWADTGPPNPGAPPRPPFLPGPFGEPLGAPGAASGSKNLGDRPMNLPVSGSYWPAPSSWPGLGPMA